MVFNWYETILVEIECHGVAMLPCKIKILIKIQLMIIIGNK
ncbi:Uncharacterized protein ChrSV_0299 [Chromobacterium vaccinii]|nr:Uncharacterized protein ChrSW_0299 [Chromobacterium vaccinii]QND87758.1 Uncharacterized protein ChrSV_0299 [Chromobacterium vaccinii]